MNSFAWHKTLAAVLGSALLVVPASIASAAPASTALTLLAAAAGTNQPPADEAIPDWGRVLPAANVAAGERLHQRCVTCHDFKKGGPDKTGPNLYGIVGAKYASNKTYAYSRVFKAAASKTWSYDALYVYLKDPKTAMPGSKMAFVGLPKPTDRIDLIAYLRTLSDSPTAIPASK